MASGFDLEAELRREPADVVVGLAAVQAGRHAKARGLESEHDVLGGREDADEHEMLVHHPDAVAYRLAWVGEMDGHPIDAYLAGVGVQQPEEHVHQGALACAVLAQKSVDLALFYFEVDGIVGHEGAEPLGYVDELELHRSLVDAPARETGARCSPVSRAVRITTV